MEYVVFSDTVVREILKELKDNISTETGGVLLGHRNGTVWNVEKMIAPGINVVQQVDAFEFDIEYVNTACNRYVTEIDSEAELLGIWHKHIGKCSVFSREDMKVNENIVRENEMDVISGIITTYPTYCLTLYHVDSTGNTRGIRHNFNEFMDAT